MKNTLEYLWFKYNLLIDFRNKLYEKGYVFKDVYFLNIQIELLDKIIQNESYNILNDLLRKTYYRLLIRIDKGHCNLINIIRNPSEWTINPIDKDVEAWVDENTLIFTTETKCAVFTHSERKIGQYKYIDNKWQ
jgi:hypothetical protein